MSLIFSSAPALSRNLLGRSSHSFKRFTTSAEVPLRTGRPWLRRGVRWSGYSLVGVGVFYAVDRTYNASAITRNFRTFWTCAMITLDYKLNFTKEKSDKIPELHERVADRIFDLFTANGGLYIKIGQSIGASAAVLPRPMQLKFAKLFDDAPQIPYESIHAVFVKELGKPPSGPDGVFEIFEEQAVASASIAQVHKAKLWPRIGPDGLPEKEERWVAVKIQKPDVSVQMEWDLAAYAAVMWLFEHVAFDLPVGFAADYISDHLRQELDFVREANNARRTAEFVANEPALRDRVYIPFVYPEYSTERVMTAEWIDGVRLSDKAGVYRLMGERPPPGLLVDTPTIDPTSSTSMVATPTSPSPSAVSSLQMPTKPLRGGVKSIMQTMVELFSAQMFSWGWVHCDPHPGNILVRPQPSNPTKPQLVLIDHGLYVGVGEEFRRDWVRLWRAMLEGDYGGVEGVMKNWGMGMPDLMASFTLMRPTLLRKGRKTKLPKTPQEEIEAFRNQQKKLSQYEMSVLMKQKLREFLKDTDRMPKQLLFLSKNMRMVQGNNQSFGSPVNRIKITGYWASQSLAMDPNLPLRSRLKEMFHHVVFRTVMLTLDIAFYTSRMRMWMRIWSWRVKSRLTGNQKAMESRGSGGFEEEMEMQMRAMAKENFGVDPGEVVFSG